MINTTRLSRCSAPALLSALPLHGQWALALRASGLQASSLGSGPGYADMYMSVAAFGGEGGRGEGARGVGALSCLQRRGGAEA